MMKRFAALFMLAPVFFPAPALAQQSGNSLPKPAEAETSPERVAGAPKVEVSGGYQSLNTGTKGWSADLEFRSKGAGSVVVQFFNASNSSSFSSDSFTNAGKTSTTVAMVGQRFTARGARTTLFVQLSAGVWLGRQSGTSKWMINGVPKENGYSDSQTLMATDGTIGATLKITDRIGVRASGGYTLIEFGALVRRLSVGVVVPFGRR